MKVGMKQAIAAIAMGVFAAGGAMAQDKKTPAAVKGAECKAAPTEIVKQDLEKGEGKDVVFRSGVLAFYTGWLYDGCAKDFKGAQFDSNADKPVPFGFIVGAGRVIKGWDEGVIGMKNKGKRLLIIPPDKAYGAEGRPGRIPPNSTLVFEVTIADVTFDPASAPKK